jgi:hypothetical protein
VTRRELIEAVGQRYRAASHRDKPAILDEFVNVTGYHRKHAIRLLRKPPRSKGAKREPQRIYDEAVREALILVWEAADRICGKRLKPLLPVLLEAMERHGHLQLDTEIRTRLLAMSAATIDRLLTKVRESACGARRKRGIATTLRRSIPVRTFADWNDPAPGYMEADLVAHCGGSMEGSFLHSFVLTDIATGWTECIVLAARDQNLITEALDRVRARLPFPLRGFDTDNDSAFINETVLEYCRRTGVEFTRSRAYRKNDQAWIEQKNGAVVRKLIGYSRLEGIQPAQILAGLYDASRLYVNFFQPSFKLKSKTRHGARVSKRYYAPATPYERLLASDRIPTADKESWRTRYEELDPIRLLQQIRTAQGSLVALALGNQPTEANATAPPPADFLSSLGTAWQEGEVRPTHRKKVAVRDWRTRQDPFEAVWPQILKWLEERPDSQAKDLFLRLQREFPHTFPDSQLRTLQRRVKQWRSEIARRLVMGSEETFLPAFLTVTRTDQHDQSPMGTPIPVCK